MKKLKVFHDIVEVVMLVIIASSVFAVMTVDFKVFGGTTATVMTAAQVVVGLTCILGGFTAKKCIDSLFEWVEEKVIEEMEEG